MFYRIIILLFAGVILVSCGEGKVSLDPEQYEPKIVVEAFLFPGQPVNRVFISRNFRVNTNLQRTSIWLPNADVSITDIQSETVYLLTYNSDEFYFEYTGTDLNVGFGKSYRLDISAKIDGKILETSSITTVPANALTITGTNYDSLPYFPTDENGDLILFDISYNRVPGVDFYLRTLYALDADTSNFIYGHAFSEPDTEPEDVLDDLNSYRRSNEWNQNVPQVPGESSISIFWFELWFYTNYQIVIYAGDKNYHDFTSTYNDVKEVDGNYHAPKFHFEGDGIGVFGSAVTDTIIVRVVPE